MSKHSMMTAIDWFACLTQAVETGDANAAVVASAELRALGWEVKATNGTWGDMPATRELMRSLEAWALEAETNRCHDNGTVDIVIKATIGELRALLGEWGRKA